MAARRKPPPTVSPALLASRGADQMARGRYRDAVESYKQLLKREPDKGWGAHLVLAYAKRAEELLAKGMPKEALMILDNAERLSTGPVRPDLALSCLIGSGSYDQILPRFFQTESLLQEHHPAVYPFLQAYVAMRLLVDPSCAGAVPEDASWHEQCAVARQAIRAYTQREDTLLDQQLKHVSRRSPFQHMRWILKSLIITDNPEQALRRLEQVPSGSPWHAFAEVARLRVVDDQTFLQTMPTLPANTQAMVATLRGIEQEPWQALSALLAAPPQKRFHLLLKLGDTGALPTERLRQASLALACAHPALLPAHEKRFGPLSPLEKSRLQALMAEQTDEPPMASHAHWQRHIALLVRTLSPEDQKLAASTPPRGGAVPVVPKDLSSSPRAETHTTKLSIALIYRRMAQHCQTHKSIHSDGLNFLEKSVAFDPLHLPSHLALLAGHQKQGKKTPYTQCLERAVRLFPEESAILHAAVQEALARKAFKKASRLAKRVLALDPLHTGVRRDLLDAALAQAGKQIHAKRLDLADKELADAAKMTPPDSHAGLIQMAQGFLHWLHHEDAQGTRLFHEGILNAGGDILAWFKAFRLAHILNLSPPWHATVQKGLIARIKEKPTKTSLLALTSTATACLDDAPRQRTQLLSPLTPFFEKGVRLDLAADEIRAICHLLDGMSHFPLLGKYASKGVNVTRNQPIFVYYQMQARTQRGAKKLSGRDQLILDRAGRRATEMGDRETAHQIAQLMKACGYVEYFDDACDCDYCNRNKNSGGDWDDPDNFDFDFDFDFGFGFDPDTSSMRFPKAMEQPVIESLAEAAQEIWNNARGRMGRDRLRKALIKEQIDNGMPRPLAQSGMLDVLIEKAMDLAGIPRS